MNTFGDRLRQARVGASLTQDELAFRMDVSKSAISAWENNKESPSFDRLARLRAIVETSLDGLICGDYHEPDTQKRPYAVAEAQSGYSANFNEQVSKDELRLLRRYRQLPVRQRRSLLILLSFHPESREKVA